MARAAILVGGLGTRLRSAVADRPKVLAEVNGRPFVAYLLDQVAAAGFREVVLCTGYMAGRVRDALGDAHGPLRLRYSPEDAPMGTAGGLRLALPFFEGDESDESDEGDEKDENGGGPVLVMNGDSYCQVDLARFVAAQRAPASMVLVHVPDAARYGQVQMGPDGLVARFVEKGAAAGPGWINAGIYALGRDLIASIPAGRRVSLEREMFPAWIQQGIQGFQTEGRFLDIGTPQTYRAAGAFFAALQEDEEDAP